MSLTLPLDDYEYIEDDAFKSASPLLRSPHLEGVTLLQTSQNSPGSLDEDVVALSFLSEPDDFSKYKSKLTTLYTNEPLQMWVTLAIRYIIVWQGIGDQIKCDKLMERCTSLLERQLSNAHSSLYCVHRLALPAQNILCNSTFSNKFGVFLSYFSALEV